MVDPTATPSSPNRRQFIQGTTAAALTGAALGTLSQTSLGAFAAGSDEIRIGLIGCGGRGSGAAVDALAADPHVKLVAMGDAFADRLQGSLQNLKESEFGDRVAVNADKQFVGFDAYQKVIDSGVDVVLLTSPPCFRPAHLKAAIAAGKHVFAEKPVATDAPGCRSVMETVREAKAKNLSIVSGLCWRYDYGMRATFDEIHAGGVGDIVTIQATYHAGTLKKFPRQSGWSEMEFQLRNWQHFVWASGDFNTEQHVHSLDKIAWAMGDKTPVRCNATGGRQARTGEESGNVYDHFAAVFDYENGVRAFASCRQMDGVQNDVSDYVFGTTGIADIFGHKIKGAKKWNFNGQKGNMYRTEHKELFAAVRAAKPINNGEYMTNSTMLALISRMSAYTGRTITWEEAWASQEDLQPAKLEWGDMPKPSIAVPGVTMFS